MAKNPDEIPDSKAVFYTVLWPSMRKAAIDCGWALALHGSMQSDMDLMAMPWTDDCKSHEVLAKAISDCIGETVWAGTHITPYYGKPHGRIVYTMSIGGGWYIDLSLMPPPSTTPKPEQVKPEKGVDPTSRGGIWNKDRTRHWCELGCTGPHFDETGKLI